MHSSHTGWSSPTGSHSVIRRRAQRSAGRQPLHPTQSFSGIGMRHTRSSARGPRGPVFIVPVCVVAFNTAEGGWRDVTTALQHQRGEHNCT